MANNRQIKARTFEVPGAGGFLLTEAAPGLERYYAVGREIAAFESPAELIAMVRYFLDHPDERDNMARAGYVRTRTEHTYESRLSKILEQLRSVGAKRMLQPWTLTIDSLAGAVERHRHHGFSGWLCAALVIPFAVVFGRERGPRAARRFVYELSWRFGGAKTYSARGLPGRLFYRES